MLIFEMQQSSSLATTRMFIMANQRVIYEKVLNTNNPGHDCVFKDVL